MADSPATDPRFWTEQIRRPVLFADAVAKAGETAAGPVVEVGPGAGLAAQAKRTLAGRAAFPLLGRGEAEEISALTASPRGRPAPQRASQRRS